MNSNVIINEGNRIGVTMFIMDKVCTAKKRLSRLLESRNFPTLLNPSFELCVENIMMKVQLKLLLVIFFGTIKKFAIQRFLPKL